MILIIGGFDWQYIDIIFLFIPLAGEYTKSSVFDTLFIYL